MKNPAVNFYTSDFLIGTNFMSNEQVGAYIRLLCYQHQHGHLTEKQIHSVTNDTEVISKFKQDKNGNFFNKRMDEEIEKKKNYSESRSRNRSNINKKVKKDMKNICNSYEEHMENEIENININKNINKKSSNRGMGEEKKKEDADDTSLLAETSKKVISYLNKKTNSNYKANTKSTLSKINARLNEGFNLDDFIVVIDKKVDEWKETEFEQYLRPDTLFSTKFEGYRNQTIVKKQKKETQSEKLARLVREAEEEERRGGT